MAYIYVARVADAWPCIITAADGSGWTRGRKGQSAGRAREIGRIEVGGGSSSRNSHQFLGIGLVHWRIMDAPNAALIISSLFKT